MILGLSLCFPRWFLFSRSTTYYYHRTPENAGAFAPEAFSGVLSFSKSKEAKTYAENTFAGGSGGGLEDR